jgi:hypothetical protein
MVEKDNHYWQENAGPGGESFLFLAGLSAYLCRVLMVQNLSARGEIHD